jgi:HSP20 family molecular chaperone IbpA
MANESNLVTRDDTAAEPVNERPAVAPPVDIYENEDEFLIVADVPGVASDAVRIHFDDGRLTLIATRGDAQETPMSSEYPSFDYRRSFLLPDGVDLEKAQADLNNGVLAVHVPKSPAVKPRRIEVRTA